MEVWGGIARFQFSCHDVGRLSGTGSVPLSALG
jgi:hypothetical protein